MKGLFVIWLVGFVDLYYNYNRKFYYSINFVIVYDGFFFYDFVVYNMKYNVVNGEVGQDGFNDNFSWNCGVEGEINDNGVNVICNWQMKNF